MSASCPSARERQWIRRLAFRFSRRTRPYLACITQSRINKASIAALARVLEARPTAGCPTWNGRANETTWKRIRKACPNRSRRKVRVNARLCAVWTSRRCRPPLSVSMPSRIANKSIPPPYARSAPPPMWVWTPHVLTTTASTTAIPARDTTHSAGDGCRHADDGAIAAPRAPVRCSFTPRKLSTSTSAPPCAAPACA